jgi:uncharacterized CHY-type Zn-finger protein
LDDFSPVGYKISKNLKSDILAIKGFKTCTTCQRTLRNHHFAKYNGRTDGHDVVCGACRSSKGADDYKINKIVKQLKSAKARADYKHLDFGPVIIVQYSQSFL